MKNMNGNEIYEGDVLTGHAGGNVRVEYEIPNYLVYVIWK